MTFWAGAVTGFLIGFALVGAFTAAVLWFVIARGEQREAALQSAAPELLAALEAIRAECAGPQATETTRRVWRIAMQAIAAAEGRA